jgi:poly-beta-1,6-N-acetyl-D-glucosamine synthase
MSERDALDMLVEFPERRESPSAVGLTRSVRGAPRPPDRGLIVALIHAHNEEDLIGAAVRSLDEQSSPPDLTIVCADNCVDGTALAAEAAGADVFVTVGNEHGRPGGLNQGLDLLLPLLRDDDAVLILDGESSLDSSFVVEARRRLTEGVGGVGGVFSDLDPSEFEGLIKSTQYARFVRDLTRLTENPRVLTGRATLFSVGSLWNVVLARAADLLPGDGSGVYNTSSMIPDGELTLALVHLGYSIVAAPQPG